jgi:probable HAF family extracellular repeat protein
MKSAKLMCLTAITLFAALALPVQLGAQHTRYKVIDIGTLGGPSAGGQGNGPGTTRFLNNAGTVVGSSETKIPCGTGCLVSHAFRWQNGVLTDLGTLPGGSSSGANAINARGWIAGFSTNDEIDPVTGGQAGHAVLWKDDGIHDLGTLGTGVLSSGNYIDNGGVVVGISTINTTFDPFAVFGPYSSPTHAFIWKNGVMRDLDTLGGPDSFIAGLCDDQRTEVVAGGSYTNSTPNPTTTLPTMEPFLWKNGTMIPLGSLGGTLGFAQCANNQGQVTGQSNLMGDSVSHPFFWDRGLMTDIGTFGGDNGFPTWMNNSGEVVGRADLPGVSGSQLHHAFLSENGGPKIDLGTLGGNSTAVQINSRHQIVGASRLDPTTNHAFLWENGGPMIDLNTLVAANPSGLTLVCAFNINDRGEITGLGAPPGVVPSGCGNPGQHPFLLIPCGEGTSQSCEDPSVH